MSDKKYRRFCVQRSYYYDTHDAFGNMKEDAPTEKEWIEQVTRQWSDFDELNLDENLIMVHDEDIETDGNPKGLHMHCIPHFKNPISEESAMKKFGASSIQNCKHCKNYSGAVQYLLHITQDAINDMKTIYTPDKIIGYALDDEGRQVRLTVREIQERMRRKTEKKKAEEEKVVSDLLIEVMEGRLLPSEVKEIYKADEMGVGLTSRKYFKDKSLYKMAEQDYLEECYRFYQSHAHPSTLIYITGAGGSGKSTLADAIAESMADIRGIHSVSVPGRSTTFDFAGKYSGQKVSVFNEVSPEAFPVEQFLDIFDPLRASVVSSRNTDKPYFAECAIFTASMPFEKFLYEMWKPYAKANSSLPMAVRRSLSVGSTEADWHNAYINCGGFDVGNKITQLRRRFAICIDIKSNSTLEIRIFQKAVNPAYSLLYTSPAFPACVPFTLFSTLPFDARLDEDTFKMLVDKAVKQIQKAIKAYYAQNGFKSPEKYARPFESDKKEKEEPKTDELSEFVDIMRISE